VKPSLVLNIGLIFPIMSRGFIESQRNRLAWS